MVFLSRIQLLGCHIRLERSEEIGRLSQNELPPRDMARGSHLEIELARDHAAAGMKSHVVRLKHKEKLLECPFAVHVHVQLRCRVLGGSHEPQSEQGAVLDLVSAFSFGGDGLVRVTDFLTPIEHSPPFFHFFSDFFYSTQHDGGGGSPKLALEKQKIHQAPEEHD